MLYNPNSDSIVHILQFHTFSIVFEPLLCIPLSKNLKTQNAMPSVSTKGTEVLSVHHTLTTLNPNVPMSRGMSPQMNYHVTPQFSNILGFIEHPPTFFFELSRSPHDNDLYHLKEHISRSTAKMGRVRTKTVKKSAKVIIERYYPKLTLDFETNKRICDEIAIIASKRLRNKVRFVWPRKQEVSSRKRNFVCLTGLLPSNRLPATPPIS
jgi:hypothetical protein